MTAPTRVSPETLERAAWAFSRPIEVDPATATGYLNADGRDYWCQYEPAREVVRDVLRLEGVA